MAIIRSHTSLEQRILAPGVKKPQGCVCMTCGRTVDSEQLVEGEPGKTTYARVLVKHHGAEELRTLDMGSVEWDAYELKSHMMRANWFDPTGNTGLGVNVRVDLTREPETERIYSTPSAILSADGRPAR